MDTTTTTTTPPSAEFLAETKAPMLYAGLWTFTAVTSVILGLRLYVRLRLSTVHGIDDALATVSWVLLAVFVAVDSVATSLGLGRHAAYLAAAGDDTVPRIVFYLWLGNSLATMANSLAKTSFAFTLLRILPQRWARTLLWAVAVSLNLANACLVVFIYAQCADARSVWDPARYPSRCWPPSVLTDFAIFVGAYSGAMDFVLAVLPWTVLPKLQMRAREKFGVAVAMSLGVVCVFFSFFFFFPSLP